MKRSVIATAIAVIAAAGPVASAAGAGATQKSSIDRGRYLVKIGGCNDCHTPGYAEASGNVPEVDWLVGVPIGYQGPWGTTYASNLRLAFDQMSEAQWMARARTPLRPPMPWFGLRDMSSSDLRALYRYVRSLGPKGEPTPAYAGPGQPVNTPYFVFVPQNPPPPKPASR